MEMTTGVNRRALIGAWAEMGSSGTATRLLPTSFG